MMRMSSVAPLALFAVVTAASLGAQAPASVPKLAYIRSSVILEAAPGRTDAEAAFEKEAEGMLAEARAGEADLQKMIADFRKAEPTMKPEARDARAAALTKKQEEFQQKQQQLQRTYQARQAEYMQPIMAQIRLVLEDMRAAEGYAIVFDADGQGTAIVASDKNLDITDRVIAKLRTMPKPMLPGQVAAPAAEAKKPAVGPVSGPAGVTRPKPPTR
jgi:outer membrane protein